VIGPAPEGASVDVTPAGSVPAGSVPIASAQPPGTGPRGAASRNPSPGGLSSTGLSPRIAAPLCYIGAWAGAIVMLMVERDSRDVRFHAWQSLLAFGALTLIAIGSLGTTILMAFVSLTAFRVMSWVTLVAWIVLAVIWLIALFQVANGKRWRMPVVGRWAERLAG
jgi:uncharacterized membrane protein